MHTSALAGPRVAALALPVLLCLGGCDVLRDQLHDASNAPTLDPPRVINAWTDSVSLVRTEPRVAVFDVRITLPDPCHDDAGVATEVVGRRVSVEVRARSWGGGCITVIAPRRLTELAVRVPAPGRYTVAFWRGDARPPIERVVDMP